MEELNKYLYLKQCQFVAAYFSSLSVAEVILQNIEDERSRELAKAIHLNALSICSRVGYVIEQGAIVTNLYPSAIIDLYNYYLEIMPDAIAFLVKAFSLVSHGKHSAEYIIDQLKN